MARLANRQAWRQLQDHYLLVLAILELDRPGTRNSDALAELYTQLHAQAGASMPDPDDLVDGPSLVWPAGESDFLRVHLGPRRVSDYWEDWTRFCSVWFRTKREPGFMSSHPATRLIWYAMNREPHLDLTQRRQLVARLWADRWILESVEVNFLTIQTELAAGIDQDAARLARLRHEADERLRSLKAEVVSLDEWFGGLHTIAPLIWHGYRVGLSERDNRTHRWFDEMLADLHGVLKDPWRLYLDRRTFFENQMMLIGSGGFHGVGSAVSPRRQLRFSMNARISFPRFWYDDALAAVDGHGVAPRLSAYSVPSAVATAIALDVQSMLEEFRRKPWRGRIDDERTDELPEPADQPQRGAAGGD